MRQDITDKCIGIWEEKLLGFLQLDTKKYLCYHNEKSRSRKRCADVQIIYFLKTKKYNKNWNGNEKDSGSIMLSKDSDF